MERFELAGLMNSISWGSVIGGVMTVLAISILLSLLSTSIGLYMIKPQSQHPTSGVGTTVGLGSAIALIISMIAGGMVAGRLAGADGMIHGFLVWATTLIIAVLLGAMLAANAARMTANIFGSISSMTGHILSVVGSGASALSDKAKEMFGDIDFTAQLKGEDFPEEIRKALAKSDVKELQPEFLQNQLGSMKSELTKSVKKIVSHPHNASGIINNFVQNQKERVSRIAQNIDRNDLVQAIANNTDMSQMEADKAIDQYLESFNKVKKEAQEQIDNLEHSLKKAEKEWNEMKQEALEAADKATNAAASSALISFFALLAAAVLCSIAGKYGAGMGWY